MLSSPEIADQFSDRINAVLNKDKDTNDEMARGYIYTENLKYSFEHFGIGMGPGSATDFLNIPPHNLFIHILVEYGIVFLVFFLVILYNIYIRIARYGFLEDGLQHHMFKSTIITLFILVIGPSTIVGEGVFWGWFGLIVAYAAVLEEHFYNISEIDTENEADYIEYKQDVITQ